MSALGTIVIPPTDVLCSVTDLSVAYFSDGGWLKAVRGVSFGVKPGEILAIVGETGSGKSTTATAMIRMLPSNGKVIGGNVSFGGRDILALSAGEMRSLRGQRVAYLPPQPMSGFTPTMRIGPQGAEPLLSHRGTRHWRAGERARDAR